MCYMRSFLLNQNNSMLEAILVASIIFLIAVFFYKQAMTEFRINQIEWSQKDHLARLRSEKLPIVIRTIPPATFWTQKDVCERSVYDEISVFHEMTLSEWIQTTNHTTVCPWPYSHAEQIAKASGISVWASKWINLSVLGYQRFWTLPKYHCWAGNRGLHKTMAWTFLFCTEGAIHVTIMPESMEQFLPAQWIGLFPADISEKDTPFLKDLKYIDVIVRPGTALFMPPHWIMSWIGSEGSPKSEGSEGAASSMVCSISYHTPISYMAFQASPYIK